MYVANRGVALEPLSLFTPRLGTTREGRSVTVGCKSGAGGVGKCCEGDAEGEGRIGRTDMQAVVVCSVDQAVIRTTYQPRTKERTRCAAGGGSLGTGKKTKTEKRNDEKRKGERE